MAVPSPSPGGPAVPPGVVGAVGTVADPRWSPDGRRLAWVRSTPRGVVLVVDGAPVPDLSPAGTRGGAFTWLDPDRLLVAGDGDLRSVDVDGAGPGSVVAITAGRVMAPAVAATSGLVAMVEETDQTCRVVVAPLDGSRAPWAVSTAAWARDPAWSSDGRLLAWHEWEEPAMPWDGSRIVVADVRTGERSVVAGGAEVAVAQPRFAPAGSSALAFVCDRGGWTNLTITRPDGRDAAVFAEGHEHAEPAWSAGQRSFAWSPDATQIAWCRNEAGFGRLVAASAPAPGDAAVGAVVGEWSRGWHRGLDWGLAGLAAVRSGARTPPSVVVLAGDPPQRRVREVAFGSDALPTDDFVEPRILSWASADDTRITGLLYTRPGAARAAPLLVHLHGGPTDQARADWAPRLQRWAARGWAVLAPNPRGSTGRGRRFTQALRGGWGATDVGDVLAGIEAAAEEGWCDPARVALVGGSGGGFTALLVAVRAPERVRAVVASYPVTDLQALAADTWRFERHYNDGLVGRLPGAADVWRDRSPVTHAASLRVPVLVLQGDSDPVVPLDQSRAFVDSVRAAGGSAELVVYEGEGHGWKRTETVADVLARTDDFLTRRVLAP